MSPAVFLLHQLVTAPGRIHGMDHLTLITILSLSVAGVDAVLFFIILLTTNYHCEHNIYIPDAHLNAKGVDLIDQHPPVRHYYLRTDELVFCGSCDPDLSDTTHIRGHATCLDCRHLLASLLPPELHRLDLMNGVYFSRNRKEFDL